MNASSIITENEIEHVPPLVACLFLVTFDTTYGYKIVWSKSRSPIDLQGLEYKCMPSGLHQVANDVVLITHDFKGQSYYGMAHFSSNLDQHQSSTPVDRSKVKMYSLGILCIPAEETLWEPNQFICNGWEYSDELKSCLHQFMDVSKFDDFQLFETLYTKITDKRKLRIEPKLSNHLIGKLPSLLQTLGPLVFCVYKQALLRKKILIFHQNHSLISNFDSGAATYLLSLLSLVPKDVEITTEVDNHMKYSIPTYNIGLNDLQNFESTNAAIGCTSDSILMYQKNLYDYAIFLPSEDQPIPFVIKSGGLSQGETPDLKSSSVVKSTLKDYHKFRLVYRDFFNKYKPHDNEDDNTSITSKSSSTFTSKFGAHFTVGERLNDSKDPGESVPMWWLTDATYPMSWREYIWSAFSWFATAGSVNNSEITMEDDEEEREEQENGASGSKHTGSQPIYGECNPHSNNISTSEDTNDESNLGTSSNQKLMKMQIIDIIEIVGQFHKLSKKWFSLINEIALEQLESNNVSNFDSLLQKITIELTYQDILDMELDPYSKEDLEFVKEFVLLYWGDFVDSVEIGLGISGICC